MTSSHHGPYDQGYTRATMAHTKRSDLARASGPHKVRRSPDWSLQLGVCNSSPDWSLQLDSMKSESLLHEVGIASNRGSECHGEYVPGPCTHRPSHHGSGLQKK